MAERTFSFFDARYPNDLRRKKICSHWREGTCGFNENTGRECGFLHPKLERNGYAANFACLRNDEDVPYFIEIANPNVKDPRYLSVFIYVHEDGLEYYYGEYEGDEPSRQERICFHYVTKGACEKSDSCLFSHPTLEKCVDS